MIIYSPWYKASRKMGRQRVDARYCSRGNTGTNFAGKPCVRSIRRATIASLRKNREKKTN